MTRIREKLFASFAIALSTSALLPQLRPSGPAFDLTAEDPVIQAVWLAVYAVAALLLFRQATPLASIIASNKLLFGFVGLVIGSVAWSDDPSVTVRRSVAFALTTLLGVYLATAFSRRELIDILAWTLAAIVAASVVFAVALPGRGLDPLHAYVWQGVFNTKNLLGRYAALGAVVWLVRVLTRRRSFVSLAGLLLCMYGLWMSDSKTALLVLVFVVGFCAVLPALRAHPSIAIPTGAIVAILVVLAASWLMHNADSAVSTLGRDPTLTGRSDIWSAVWPLALQHSWLGYGYGAFWQGMSGPSATVWAIVGFGPPHAHNGYLDVFVQVGGVGVLLLAGALVVLVVRATHALREGWSLESILPAALLLFIALYNIPESSLAIHNSLFWVLLVATSVQLAPNRAAAVVVAAPRLSVVPAGAHGR